MRRGAMAVLTVMTFCGCGPSSVWHTVSPDHHTAVEIAEWQDRACVRIEGGSGWCFDGVAVRELVFSSDSRHIAYPVLTGGRWVVVHDGQMGSQWNGVSGPVFSPTGEKLAYAALDGGAWRMVVDGAAGEPFDSLYAGTITFDASGTRFAYAAQRNGHSYVVVDGETGPGHQGIGSITFSPNGLHIAYTAREAGQAIVFVDGVKRSQHESIGELAFSDADRLAYAAYDQGGWYAVEGETMLGPYSSITNLAYRPADSLLTFVAGADGGQVVVAGGVPGLLFEGVDAPAFSESGTRWGYVGHDSARSTVIVDGDVLRQEEYATDLTFSPDGSRLAYLAWDGDDAFVVDDTGRHPFDVLIDGTLVFSRDGRAWACLAGDRERRELFVNVEGTSHTPDFDWSALMQIAWRESVEDGPDAPTTDALRDWVAAELEIVMEASRR